MMATIPSGQVVSAVDVFLPGVGNVEYVWVIKLPDYVPPRDTDAVVFVQILDYPMSGEISEF
jgi:hypothetical protein